MTTKTVETPTAEAGASTVPARRYLTREDILGADDLRTEDVYCAEWGGWIAIRSLTGTERDAYEASMIEGRGPDQEINLQNIRARLVAKTAVGPDGTPIFRDGDERLLGAKNASPLQRAFEVAQRLSRLTAADVTELADSLGNGQNASSGTD